MIRCAGAICERFEVQIDVGVADFVIRGAITDDQQHGVRRGVVDEAMAVPSTGRKAGAHSGRENLLSGISLKRDLSFKHIDELILS